MVTGDLIPAKYITLLLYVMVYNVFDKIVNACLFINHLVWPVFVVLQNSDKLKQKTFFYL